MVRLQPCPSCGRHIRVSDRACPFCQVGFAPAPSRLSVALLGLALVACAGGTDSANKSDDKKAPAKADEVKPPEATTAEPTTAIEPPVEPPVEPPAVEGETGAEPEAETTAAPEPDNENVGTTDGSAVVPETEAVKKPPQKTKYGAPRPAKKYGGPPMPGPEDDPF